MTGSEATRSMSAALFGNEKFAEVIASMGAQEGAVTAQQLSKVTGIDHSLVRKVLLRGQAAGIVDALPRTGGSRSPLYYQPVTGSIWDATYALAAAVVRSSVVESAS